MIISFKNNFPFIFNHIKKESLKINHDFLSNRMESKNSDDSVNSNQSWNKTNDQLTGYGDFETQRRCHDTKLKFKLNYDYNITNMMNNREINTFMSDNKIYNKVKLNIKVISFGYFPPENDKFDILPFVINTLIVDNLNNKKIQQLYKLDMLRFNDGIHFSDNIIRRFLLSMKYQSAKNRIS